MVCEQVRNELSAYLDGELAPPEAAAVRDHVDACPACREVLEELRATIDLVGGLPCCGAPKHLAADVQREIERRMILSAPAAPADEAPQERLLPIRRASPWPRVLAVAATLVLGLGIGLLSYLGTPGPRVRQPAPRAARETMSETYDLAFRQAAARPDDAAGKDLGVRRDKTTPYGAEAGAKDGEHEEVLNERLATRVDAPVLKEQPVPAGTNGNAAALADASWGMAVEEEGVALHGVTGGGAATDAAATIEAVALAEDASGTLDLQGDRLSVLATPEVALQLAMVSVMTGRAGVENLKRAATPDNLARIGNQLVIETESRDRANEDLTRLLGANGMAPLDGPVEAWTYGRAGAVEAKLKRPEEPRPSPAPAGFYYLAHHDGEDTYVVVTDLDNLSRFGSQLAAADDLPVSERSSDLLRGVRGLQLARRAREQGIVEGLETAEQDHLRADEGGDLAMAPALEKRGASVFGGVVTGEAAGKEGAKEEMRPKADLGKVAEPSAPAPAVAARKVSEEASNLDEKAAVTGDEHRVQGEVGQAVAGAPVQEALGQPPQAPAATPPGAEEPLAQAAEEMPAQHGVGGLGQPAASPSEAPQAPAEVARGQAKQTEALGSGEAKPLDAEVRGTGRRQNGHSAKFAPQKGLGTPRAAGAGGRSTPAAAPVAGPRAGGTVDGGNGDVPRTSAGGFGLPAWGRGEWFADVNGAVTALGFPVWLGENQVILVIRVLPAAKEAAAKAAPEAKPAEAEAKEAPAEGDPKPAPSH